VIPPSLRHRAAGLAIALAVPVLAGCGHAAPAATAATAAATPAATRAATSPRLVAVWRNFEETGIPEDLAVFRDGRFRYRNLLHTQRGIGAEEGRLRPGELRRLRRLLARTDLARADASGVVPRRSGFRYVITAGGEVGTAADGHLHGRMRPLVRALGRLMDRLRAAW
jgi:hypothetical protein